jgi:hypothetical protein
LWRHLRNETDKLKLLGKLREILMIWQRACPIQAAPFLFRAIGCSRRHGGKQSSLFLGFRSRDFETTIYHGWLSVFNLSIFNSGWWILKYVLGTFFLQSAAFVHFCLRTAWRSFSRDDVDSARRSTLRCTLWTFFLQGAIFNSFF